MYVGVGISRAISKLDLAKGFYQIAVEPDSVDKTAFITPFGKYAFQNAVWAQERPGYLSEMYGGCVRRMLYLCSFIHRQHYCVLGEWGGAYTPPAECVCSFTAAWADYKCEFGRCTVVYLGHVIGNGVLAVPRHRAIAMADFIQPRTKKQLRAFLGAASYYRRFVKGFANFSSVLTPATSKAASSVVGWSEAMLEAFHHIKLCLCDVCTLIIPSQEDSFVLHTDVSGAGIGATLNVFRDGMETPAAFFSRQLQGAQHNYSATELEGLAIFKAINFFAHFLYGRRFVIVTDHKALVAFLKSRVLNKRLHG